jgi:hypothetical protein
MHHSLNRRTSALLLIGLCSAAARAQDTPPLTLTATYSVENDETTYPVGTVTDQIGKAELGLLFHTIQGLQTVDVNASVVNYQYQTDTTQDHTEANYNATWQWAVTPRLRGNLTGTQQEAPRADAISAAGNGPNRQTQVHYRADAEYEVDGPWHVVAGVTQDKHTSQYTDPSNPDSLSDARDLGLRYDFSSGSWMKLSVRALNGSYLNGSYVDSNTLAVISTDDSYQQQEQELRMHWSVRSATNADVYLTQVSRTHQINTQVDFSGLNYGGSFGWELTSRSGLTVDYVHELSVALMPVAMFTQRNALSWGANWQISSRTALHFRQALEQLDYRLQPGDSASVRQDSSHDSSLTLVWTPSKPWQLSAALQQQEHSSDMAGQGYTAQQISVSAQYSY